MYVDSPRVYISTNPWKMTATFQTISSTRDEYLAIIDKVKDSSPGEYTPGARWSKLDAAHLALIQALEDRLPAIDAEIAVGVIPCSLNVAYRSRMGIVHIIVLDRPYRCLPT